MKMSLFVSRTVFAVLLLLSVSPSYADIFPVLPGESIQAQLDIAQSGDTVAVFGGTYSEDLLITNGVRLAEVSGQEVTLLGNLRISGVTNAPPLEGFTIGSSGRGLTIENSATILLKDLEVVGTGLVLSGAMTSRVETCSFSQVVATIDRLEMTESNSGPLTMNAGNLFIFNSTFTGDIELKTSANKCVVHRCDTHKIVNRSASQLFVGYSTPRRVYSSAPNAHVVVVGNIFEATHDIDAPIHVPGSATQVLAANNIIVNENNSTNPHRGIDIGSPDTEGFIINNYVQIYRRDSYTRPAIRILSPNIKIISNIIVGGGYNLEAPFGTLAQGNFMRGAYHVSWTGGVIPTETSTAVAMDPAPDTFYLPPDSPAIDNGASDPLYNDRDGTRSDAGHTGGAWYDPDGWTTDNPVMFSFDLSPEQILEGVGTEIILSNGQAVSQP